MASVYHARRPATRLSAASPLPLAIALLSVAACNHPMSSGGSNPAPASNMSTSAPSPDPRVGLKAGQFNAQEAMWNMHVVSQTPPSEKFKGITNSDLAFTGPYAIQGNYNGFQVWDISNPSAPTLKTS